MTDKVIASRIIKTEPINWRNLQFIQQDNFKEWIANGDKKLIESLLKYQFADPFKVWEHEGILYCLDGKHRFMDLSAVAQMGYQIPELLPATFIDCENMKEAAELVLVYSSAYAKITQQGLLEFVQTFDLDFPDMQNLLNIPEFDSIAFEGMLNEFQTGEPSEKIVPASLKDSFIFPPFSVLDTRSGVWQDRKRKWLALGFNSQETREDVELIAKSGQSTAIYELRNKMRESLKREPTWDEIIDYAKQKGMHVYEGASIFDPVLCELLYKWFCTNGGSVLDPFAGGSVRGVVAGVLGYPYEGIDLREDQVEANRKQASILSLENVNWITGDSNEVLDRLSMAADFLMSCPPYADLEKYSDDPKDLSNMDYKDFKEVYFSIIKKSVAHLKEDRFAAFVVGDVRDKKGFYYNFVSDTIQAFKEAGMELYNEIILVNVVGSLAIRVRRQFNGGRKVGKMHQNVLVFYKGDPKKIKGNYPELNLGEDLEALASSE
ncbi:class I SAM-dependent methyltransferase [Flavobacterium sp. 102]|uniref:class I SAM-dependent methyltransferase n=1 Tax=Flavobacterium sp. 102 TaxID=2135623 RepID=UPI000EB39A92|nr:class I SAM-dependent methyltransferase [Flavobacterium sp. 102]